MAFEIYPGIDLKEGRCARLAQGDFNRARFYDVDPVALAIGYKDEGAQWIHVVDLDAAQDGRLSRNFNIVTRIQRETGLRMEYGGGIRSMEQLDRIMDEGISRVFIGTAAVTDPEFLAAAAVKYPGRIAADIGARDGYVHIRGWTQRTQYEAAEFAHMMEQAGAAAVLFTDKARDGMMTGSNLKEMQNVADALHRIPLIGSGGVGTLDHIRDIAKHAEENIEGIVIGTALLEGRFKYAEAVACTALTPA